MSVMRIRKSGYTPPPGPKRIEEAEEIRKSLESDLQEIAFDAEDALTVSAGPAKTSDQILSDSDPLYFMLESLRREKVRLVEQIDQSSRTSSRLATLYAVVERLHASVKRSKVCDAIADIVMNVIGAEQFALFELHSSGACLNLIASAGVDVEPLREVGFGEGLVGRVAASGRLFVKRGEDLSDGALWEETLSACVPLKIGGRLTGVIALFGMQLHKLDFTPIDLEMFELLSKHAALALHAADTAASNGKKKKE